MGVEDPVAAMTVAEATAEATTTSEEESLVLQTLERLRAVSTLHREHIILTSRDGYKILCQLDER